MALVGGSVGIDLIMLETMMTENPELVSLQIHNPLSNYRTSSWMNE